MNTSNRQTVRTWRGGDVQELQIPCPTKEVIPGVLWGRFDEFFTPAFWKARLWIDGDPGPMADYVIGGSLREEIAACLLGGFGMPAEVGLAAFHRLRDLGMLDGTAAAASIERALREPLRLGDRFIKYRYPQTKSRFVSIAMQRLRNESAPLDSPLALRSWLLTFDGIGPKTASWITRNVTGSDDVAILDVHIVRAGLLMGLFSPAHNISRDYFNMETRLIAFAHAITVKLSAFDSILWCYMRQLSRLANDSLSRRSLPANRLD
jgi:N-glycosylase/DNA lyase